MNRIFQKYCTRATKKRPLSFIEFQNTSLCLLFLRPSYLLGLISNSMINHDLRTMSIVFSNTLRLLIFAVKALPRILKEIILSAVIEKLVLLTKTRAKINRCKSVIHRDFLVSFPLYLKELR